MIPAFSYARRSLRGAGVVLVAAGLLVAATLPAGAHVRVTADNPTAGGFSVLTFRVPNESDTAKTVKLAVTLPTDTPFLYVSTKPVPGWTVSAPRQTLPAPVDVDATTITKAVRTITWTANRGGGIGPGEFEEFAISVGPLPDPATILLPARQTYSDGTAVDWDQPTPPSGEEPEHPAPELTIVAASGSGDEHDADTTAGSPSDPSGASPMPVESGGGTGGSGDGLARVLAGAGLVAGLAALIIALLSRRHRDPA